MIAEEAKMSGQVILLLDEIHRLDKGKQDFLLPHLENGQIILIGATTSNPYHAINPAIRSRTQIFELYPLTEADIKTALLRAINDKEKGYGNDDIEIDEAAINHFVQSAQGDIRTSLNALELAILSAETKNPIKITLKDAKDCLQKSSFQFDKDGDMHYDLMSAFQKSIRGSDVDAALHYLARLIEAWRFTDNSQTLTGHQLRRYRTRISFQQAQERLLRLNLLNDLDFPKHAYHLRKLSSNFAYHRNQTLASPQLTLLYLMYEAAKLVPSQNT